MSTPGALHHVEIYVADLATSLSFWEPFLTRLGYVESQRWGEGVSYALGQTYLVFVQASATHLAAGYHRKRVGLNHLAFHAASRTQVDEVTAWASASGFNVLYQERHPFAGGAHYYALYCEDPDKIKVELVAPVEST